MRSFVFQSYFLKKIFFLKLTSFKATGILNNASLKKVFQEIPNQNIYPKNLIKRDLDFAYKSSLLIYFDIQGNSRGDHYSYIVNNVIHVGEKT